MTQLRPHPDLLLWQDCEFTGFSLSEGHRIYEIAAVVTDRGLHEIESYASFIYIGEANLRQLLDSNPWWSDRPKEEVSRVLENVANGMPAETVDSDMEALVLGTCGFMRPAVCGNSTFRDRLHIEAQLPKFHNTLHYQGIDVTSLKLVHRFYGLPEYTGKRYAHHALDDVRESIDEFRFLLESEGIQVRDVSQ